MYSAMDIAKYIINYSNEKDYPISNLRLQKLLYFVQANFISQSGRVCFGDSMQCWQYGPVIPSVYSKFKIYGSDSIPVQYDTKSRERKKFRIKDLKGIDRNMIVEVIDEASTMSPSQLVSITHGQDPWRKNYKVGKNNELPIKSMYDFFGDK